MSNSDTTRSAVSSGRDKGDSSAKLPVRARDRYQFGDERGRGGIGRVTWARDRDLARDVGIKELLDPGTGHEARFVREAMITARLQHPSIVPIYEAGQWSNGQPFYAMKMVSGQSLKELVSEAGSYEARLALVSNVLDVAEAIAYAHSERVIHRDLKPSNVIVGEFGETVVIDWGLARDISDEAPDELLSDPYRTAAKTDLTRTGAVVGTPAYMSPEQANGDPVDETTDVYALGAMLYFVVSGRTPYAGDDSDSVLEKVKSDGPQPITDLVTDVAVDLASIIERAMARAPSDRYKSANEFAEDLRRFRNGSLVEARDYSGWALLRHFVGRHRTAVLLSTAFLAIAIVGSLLFLTGLVTEQRRTDRERERAESALLDVRGERDRLILVQARSLLASDGTAAVAALKTYKGTNWAAVRDVAADAAALGIAKHVYVGRDLWAPDAHTMRAGDRLLFADGERLLLWNIANGKASQIASNVQFFELASSGAYLLFLDSTGQIFRHDVASSATKPLDFLPEDGFVVSLSEPDEHIYVGSPTRYAGWNSAGELVSSITRSNLQYQKTSDNGALVLSCLKGWELMASHLPRNQSWEGRCGGVMTVARNDRRAVVAQGVTLDLFDIEDGWTPWKSPMGYISLVGISHAGDRFLVADPQRKRITIRRFDNPTAEVTRVSSRGSFSADGFSPDGSLVALGDSDGAITIRGLANKSTRIVRAHSDELIRVEVTNDGTLFSTASDSVRVHESRASSSPLVDVGHFVTMLAFSPNGEKLAVATRSGNVWLRDLRSGQERRSPEKHNQVAADACWLSDSKLASVSASSGTVQIWDITKNEAAVTVVEDGKGVSSVACLPDSRIAFAGRSGAFLWDGTDAPTALDSVHPANYVAATSDGSHVIATDADGRLRIWNLATNDLVTHRPHKGPATGLAVSTGGLIVTSGRDGTLETTRIGAEPSVAYSGPLELTNAQISPDGKHIAGLADDRAIVVEVSSTSVVTLRTNGARATSLAFSSSGRYIAVGSSDGFVRVARLADGHAQSFVGDRSEVVSLAFAPDEQALAVALSTGDVSSWPLGTFIPLEEEKLRDWLREATTAEIDDEFRLKAAD